MSLAIHLKNNWILFDSERFHPQTKNAESNVKSLVSQNYYISKLFRNRHFWLALCSDLNYHLHLISVINAMQYESIDL